MKTPFAVAVLASSTQAISNKLKVEAESFVDPLAILAETSTEAGGVPSTSSTGKTRGSEDYTNPVYGHMYDSYNDELYNCLYNEIHKFSSNTVKYWHWTKSNWVTMTRNGREDMSASYEIVYPSGEHEFFDFENGQRVSSLGHIITKSHKYEDKKNEYYNLHAKVKVYEQKEGDWTATDEDPDDYLLSIGLRDGEYDLADSSDASDYKEADAKVAYKIWDVATSSDEDIETFCKGRRDHLAKY